MYESEKILRSGNINKIIKERNKKIEILENQEVVIYGCGKLGKSIFNNASKSKIKVKCFIDNKEYTNESYKGIKIYNLSNFIDKYNDELIILGSILYDTDMEIELNKNGITNVISYSFLCEYDNKRFPPYDKGYGYLTQDLLRNSDKYIGLFNEIEDSISLKVLDNILMYRITMNKKYLMNAYEISKSKNGEYFDENIIKLSSEEVFIDGGAFKGETTRQFKKITSDKYKRIEIFEPDEDLYNETVNNIKGESINYNLEGLGRKKEILKFNKTGDEGGAIDKNGSYEIKINSIDNVCKNDPVTFIKLDIEGAELDAIYGAKQTITKYKPKMAISAYHKAEDLWKLYYTIKSMNSTYKVYIRHYSKSNVDTDFYYIN